MSEVSDSRLKAMPSKKRVCIETSASIANFGPGFDTFGLCIDHPIDRIEATIHPDPGIALELDQRSFEVPLDPDRNTASVAATEMIRLASSRRSRIGIRMKILKGIRPGSGLGSSAASAVGGAMAAATLLGVDDQKLILRAASIGEGVSSGAPHLDNVSPCLYGGFTAVIDSKKMNILKITPPPMKIVVCLPEIIVETAMARRLIPQQLSVRSVVAHVGWASGMIHGLMDGDIELIASCLMDDIAVPARKRLIRGFDSVHDSAMKAGALSFSISGSGPAVYSLAKRGHDKIGKAMVESFAEVGVKSRYFIARPGKGAKIV